MVAKRRTQTRGLFARWFWVVYLPLGLLVASILLMIFGVFPKRGIPGLVLLAAYGALATRLLMERRRKGLAVPPPRSIIIGIGSVTAILLIGSTLFVVGMNRLSEDQGLVMALAGGFLMIASVTIPAFKAVDSIARRIGRIFKKSGSSE